MALHYLIYQSKAAIPFDDESLTTLLTKARVFNSSFGITGILLFGNGTFLQMLEGEEDVIKSLFYLKIAPDPRHHSPRIIKEGAIDQQLFGRWAMAFRPLAPELFQPVEGFVNPDEESEYGKDLLHPLQVMQTMSFLSQSM